MTATMPTDAELVDRPDVSVCILSYNHAKFIRQAIESVLAQESELLIEIIVSDDASTDGTQKIVAEFSRSLGPARFRAILRDVNVGVAANLFGLLGAATGRYVAYLEGDDFWTSHRKIQTQVEFLDQHPDFVATFHEVSHVAADGVSFLQLHCGPDQKSEVDIVDLFSGNCIPSCSVVFRNRLFDHFPAWSASLQTLDWVLHVLNAQHGKTKYLNENWGAYRHHAGGVWSHRPWSQNVEEMVRTLRAFYDNLDPVYRTAIARQIIMHKLDLAGFYAREGRPGPTITRLADGLVLSLSERLLSTRLVKSTVGLPLRLLMGIKMKGRRPNV